MGQGTRILCMPSRSMACPITIDDATTQGPLSCLQKQNDERVNTILLTPHADASLSLIPDLTKSDWGGLCHRLLSFTKDRCYGLIA